MMGRSGKELFSKFVAFLGSSTVLFNLFKRNKTPYKVVGSCKMCGKCCRALILGYRAGPVRSLRQFRRLVKEKPDYAMFEPHEKVGKDGYLRFACRNLTADGKCGIHDDRPELCRRYPDPIMMELGGTLPAECGYKFVPEAEFGDFLEEELKKK